MSPLGPTSNANRLRDRQTACSVSLMLTIGPRIPGSNTFSGASAERRKGRSEQGVAILAVRREGETVLRKQAVNIS